MLFKPCYVIYDKSLKRFTALFDIPYYGDEPFVKSLGYARTSSDFVVACLAANCEGQKFDIHDEATAIRYLTALQQAHAMFEDILPCDDYDAINRYERMIDFDNQRS